MTAASLDPEELGAFLRTAGLASGFRRSETPAYYQWLLGPRAGSETVSLVALDGRRIAGALTAVLRPLHVAGETILAAKLEEMKTDPRDRGRGVMTFVFKGVTDACAERGVGLLFAGPTSQFSYPIFLKRFRFEEPFTITTFASPLRIPGIGMPIPVLSAARRTSGECSDRIPDDAAERAQEWGRLSSIAWNRSPAWLRWRYETSPDRYRVVVMRASGVCRGIALWKETLQRGLRIANVVEFLAADARDEGRLLGHVARAVRASSRAEVIALWKPVHLGTGSLVARGFLPLRSRTHFLVRRLDTLHPTFLDRLRDQRQWHLSMGDYFDV